MTNYPIDEALKAEESTIVIELTNKVLGSTCPRAAVYATSTLEQVLLWYGEEIGVNLSDRKLIFTNKRTGASTSDTSETVESLGLQEGDVLSVVDDGGVA